MDGWVDDEWINKQMEGKTNDEDGWMNGNL